MPKQELTKAEKREQWLRAAAKAMIYEVFLPSKDIVSEEQMEQFRQASVNKMYFMLKLMLTDDPTLIDVLVLQDDMFYSGEWKDPELTDDLQDYYKFLKNHPERQ